MPLFTCKVVGDLQIAVGVGYNLIIRDRQVGIIGTEGFDTTDFNRVGDAGEKRGVLTQRMNTNGRFRIRLDNGWVNGIVENLFVHIHTSYGSS